jgi:hypothetical protein
MHIEIALVIHNTGMTLLHNGCNVDRSINGFANSANLGEKNMLYDVVHTNILTFLESLELECSLMLTFSQSEYVTFLASKLFSMIYIVLIQIISFMSIVKQ